MFPINIRTEEWLFDDFWYRQRPSFLYQTEGRFRAVDFRSAIRYTSKPYAGRRAVISLSRSLRRFLADHGYIAEFLVKFPDKEQTKCYLGTTNGWAGRGLIPDEPHKGVYFRCYNDDDLGNWEVVWRKSSLIKTIKTSVQMNRKKYIYFKIVKSGDITWKFNYFIEDENVGEIIADVNTFGTDLIPWVQVSSMENKSKSFEIDVWQLRINRQGPDPLE